MPVEYSTPVDRRTWPVKLLRGSFSDNKRVKLEHRYARRRIRVQFAPA